MKSNIIFFDLDGTIIDSAPQIIHSLEHAFNFFKVKPIKKITSKLIGPPVNCLIDELLTAKDHLKASNILREFKYIYDNKFCYESNSYDGIEKVLQNLSQKNSLILVTNKRLIPTKKILKHKNLVKYFESYYSVNTDCKTIYNKELLLKKITKEKNFNKNECFYIGDTYSDFISSKNNNINFIYAKWGYGEIELDKNFLIANKPSDLEKFL